MTGASSDEPDNGPDDGDTVKDITFDGCQAVKLRAERNGLANGRVYTIEVAVQDEGGGVGTASFQVHVPVSPGSMAVDDGPAYSLSSGCDAPSSLIATAQKAPSDTAPASAKSRSAEIPSEVTLAQNFPNPFRVSTIVEFGLPARSDASLRVFDVAGRTVATLAAGTRGAGYHRVPFDASALSAGLYVLVLEADGVRQIRRMTLLR